MLFRSLAILRTRDGDVGLVAVPLHAVGNELLGFFFAKGFGEGSLGLTLLGLDAGIRRHDRALDLDVHTPAWAIEGVTCPTMPSGKTRSLLAQALSRRLGDALGTASMAAIRADLETLIPDLTDQNVEVTQDPNDPTRINVRVDLPVAPYISGTYVVGRNAGVGEHRVSGGSWKSPDVRHIEPSFRNRLTAETASSSMGFRTHLTGRTRR